MCGRYTLVDLEALPARFKVAQSEQPLTPRYNVAPTQIMPVIVAADGARRIVLMRWGLVPSWAKDAGIGSRMINARAETLAEKPSFRQALARRRCLVPADGFYEWQKIPGGKQPYYITVEGGLFALAGLWERWRDAQGGELLTFTIATVAPNVLMSPIHDRMPAILAREAEALWLDPAASPAEAQALLAPCPAGAMQARAVSTLVNSPANEGRELLAS